MLKHIALGQHEGDGSSSSEESTGSRRSSFSHQEEPHGADMSPNLQLRFEFNLRAIAHPKIKSTFEHNLPVVLQDPGLPRFIKALLVEKMSAMARILGDMALQSPSKLLLKNDQETSHFPAYQEASRRLKADLIMHKDAAGVTFSGRSLKLFSWCQAELTETAHPLVGFLMDALTTLEIKKDAEERFKRLADISNLLVLQITCGDDISDNIQDEVLVPFFVNIPLSDEIRASKGLPSRAESLAFVGQHRDGIFSAYYETAVAIWDDAIVQLTTLFGDTWEAIAPEFLKLHDKAMGSLTYSILMNITPHDPSIVLANIMDNLAPNMMVECFRFLEKSLVMQIATEQRIALPDPEAIAVCDALVHLSQRSASLANSTATASREMRENDISNPIPFELNKAFTTLLLERDATFVDSFEKFLRENGYTNHFFSHYYDLDEAGVPADFNCLSLLMLRKFAVTQILVNLSLLSMEISPEDYVMDHLATTALKQIAESKNEQNKVYGRALSKYKKHIGLIDRFFEGILKETNVETHLFDIWKQDIDEMRTRAVSIQEPTLKKHAETYVTSWEDFLCMYLLFKRAYDGTI